MRKVKLKASNAWLKIIKMDECCILFYVKPHPNKITGNNGI
jgi:hypothetical protein